MRYDRDTRAAARGVHHHPALPARVRAGLAGVLRVAAGDRRALSFFWERAFGGRKDSCARVCRMHSDEVKERQRQSGRPSKRDRGPSAQKPFKVRLGKMEAVTSGIQYHFLIVLGNGF